jgi:DNA-binding NarL/FixJ family response regulator
MSTKRRLLLADDHAMVREGLCAIIASQDDLEVVGQTGSGREAIKLAQQLQPELVILDVSMPDLNGTEAAQQIVSTCPHTRVLALTRHADQGYLRRMLRAGVSGYVLKRDVGDALIRAIRAVLAGGTAIDPQLAGDIVSRVIGWQSTSPDRPRAELSERETQVLRLIAWGHSNKEAAASLGLSVKTVEAYRATAIDKLQLRTRSDILRYALSQGWLSSDDAPD